MRRVTAIILGMAFLLLMLAACGKKEPAAAGSAAAPAEAGSLKIVATIFPEYDWVQNILGDNPGKAEVTLLMNKGVDLHSFQPSVEDITKISSCDVFIYVGGESDEWAEDALKEAVNPDMIVIDLLEELGSDVKEEELMEGMEEPEEEHEHEEEGEVEYDEHVWLSLRNAETLCRVIADRLKEADPVHADAYQANTDAYLERLAALDQAYETAISAAPLKTLIFGDRFPFRYLADDYGLTCFAAFAGCSAETEASFETVTFLADKIDETGVRAVMIIDGSDRKLAETIIKNTKTQDQKILTLDSMQSLTAEKVREGASYLSLMEKNLAVLEEALQ